MAANSNMHWISMSDAAIVETIGTFVRHHRLQQNKTQQQVANDASINRSTLVQLESGNKVTLLTLIQVLRVLDLLYVIEAFKVQEQISPLLLAKAQQSKRQRASKTDSNDQKPTDW